MITLATGSPPEALAWLRQGEPFDVALVDRQMPDMDGLMLAAEIQAAEAAALPLYWSFDGVERGSGGRRDVCRFSAQTNPGCAAV